MIFSIAFLENINFVYYSETRIFARIKKSSQNASISEKDAFWDDFFIRAKMYVFEKILFFYIFN